MLRLDQFPKTVMPKHGGRLQEAIAKSCFSASEWLDLSTGINPNSWPVPSIPTDTFQRLPEADCALEDAAYDYYLSCTNSEHRPNLLAIPGSQWVIQHFPQAVKSLSNNPTLNVLLPQFGFSEHAFWWQHHQHRTNHYQDTELNPLLSGVIDADVMVIINPNNPTTHFTLTQDILKAAQNNPGTLFIVDEAFIDSQSEHSLLNTSLPFNVIILRSLGKFFGLAGLRVGFVFAQAELIAWLKTCLGPWPIATPSRWVATQALRDKAWHTTAKIELKSNMQQLTSIIDSALANHDFSCRCTDFFLTLDCGSSVLATKLYNDFKQQAVLTRLVEDSSLLRIGLPKQNEMSLFKDRLITVFDQI